MDNEVDIKEEANKLCIFQNSRLDMIQACNALYTNKGPHHMSLFSGEEQSLSLTYEVFPKERENKVLLKSGEREGEKNAQNIPLSESVMKRTWT